MSRRQLVQMGLRNMAEKDQADQATQWGGLVFYESGRLEAKLYPAGQQGNNKAYVASDRMLQDGTDSLAYFHGHLNTWNNASAAGPDAADLEFAKHLNWYGVVVTSMDADSFNATYYNPAGVVVSLGNFPFANAETSTTTAAPAVP